MKRNWSHTGLAVLDMTLKLLYLLTGEEYVIVKKSVGDHVIFNSQPHVLRGWSWKQTFMELTVASLIQDSNIEKKIQEVANKIIELLTGEVPVRCQDVAVYLSMEEREYLEGHWDLYKAAMMEEEPPLTSLDGFRKRNPPETCSRPLYSQDSAQEEHSTPQDDQDQNPIVSEVKWEEEAEDVRGEGRGAEEEISPQISPDNRNRPADQMNIKVEEDKDQEIKIKEEGAAVEISAGSRDWTATQSSSGAEQEETHINNEDVDNPTETSTGGEYGRNSPGVSDGDLTYVSCEIPNLHPASQCAEPVSHSSEPQGVFFDHSYAVIHHIPQIGETFLCSDCGRCFDKKLSLFRHRKIKHMEKKLYKCSECGKCYNYKSRLLLHERVHTGERPFTCSECGKTFAKKFTLEVHQRTHMGEEPYSCSERRKPVLWKSTLVEKQRNLTGSKSCSCPESRKCFGQRSEVHKHQRSHPWQRSYSCLDCGRGFLQEAAFLLHQKGHIDNKLLFCSWCRKGYAYKADLAQHERSHTGVRPFPCPECGKCFAKKYILTKHLRIHTGVKPFTCTECGKCFAHRWSLILHQKTHTGVRPYTCSKCEKCFAHRPDLLNHERAHSR